MKHSSLSSKSGLMLALDVQDANEAEAIVDANIDYIDAIKIGSTTIVSPSGGFGLISNLHRKHKLPILVDSKLLDVPHVLLSTARSFKAHGATTISCWADIGSTALKFLINNLKGEIEIVVLTALTSLPYESVEKTAKKNILMAIDCGCMFIQIPGNFPELIKWARKYIPKEAKILSCGVGAQGGVIGEAIKCGADFEIIGRKILDSMNGADLSRKLKKFYSIIHEAAN